MKAPRGNAHMNAAKDSDSPTPPNGIVLDQLTHTQRRILELLQIKPPWPQRER